MKNSQIWIFLSLMSRDFVFQSHIAFLLSLAISNSAAYSNSVSTVSCLFNMLSENSSLNIYFLCQFRWFSWLQKKKKVFPDNLCFPSIIWCLQTLFIILINIFNSSFLHCCLPIKTLDSKTWDLSSSLKILIAKFPALDIRVLNTSTKPNVLPSSDTLALTTYKEEIRMPLRVKKLLGNDCAFGRSCYWGGIVQHGG